MLSSVSRIALTLSLLLPILGCNPSSFKGTSSKSPDKKQKESGEAKSEETKQQTLKAQNDKKEKEEAKKEEDSYAPLPSNIAGAYLYAKRLDNGEKKSEARFGYALVGKDSNKIDLKATQSNITIKSENKDYNIQNNRIEDKNFHGIAIIRSSRDEAIALGQITLTLVGQKNKHIPTRLDAAIGSTPPTEIAKIEEASSKAQKTTDGEKDQESPLPEAETTEEQPSETETAPSGDAGITLGGLKYAQEASEVEANAEIIQPARERGSDGIYVTFKFKQLGSDCTKEVEVKSLENLPTEVKCHE